VRNKLFNESQVVEYEGLYCHCVVGT